MRLLSSLENTRAAAGTLTACRVLLASLALLTMAVAVPSAYGNKAETVRLVVDHEISKPVEHALAELESALKEKGNVIHSGSQIDTSCDVNLVIGVPGQSQQVDQILQRYQLSVASTPESLLVAKLSENDVRQVLVAGCDPRGTAYALLEIAQSIRSASDTDTVLATIREQRESPFLKVRSVTQQVFNEDVERSWYEDEAFWHWYFGMMAKNRLNNFSLTFGHNANYMIPPYAWMVQVAEYPDVKVAGMTPEERETHLHRFRRITEIAEEHGVDFTIGLWTQLPVVDVREGLDFGDSPVINLPEGPARGDYCAKGLQKLLELCPCVDGVQLRMNLESGIPHEQQEEYYQALFGGVASCGRAVKVDLRYKSLSQQTINLAREAGLEVNVSTKHWCEHMGLPFHPTWEDAAYSASRYGFGSMLYHGRNYSVTYRLWNVGTSRLLLWGDPGFAARFAENCTVGGGEGFEVFAPLSYQGYGDAEGAWRIFANADDEHYQWEQQRYWSFYLAFGRWGYNPNTSREVWLREFVQHFGETNGPRIEQSLRSASQVLPLITATTQFSAGGFRFWPEMMTCMHLDAYRAIQPGDYSQFYAIAPFDTRRHWRAEGWASKHSAFVEDSLNDNLNSKWSPIQVSELLAKLATQIEMPLDGLVVPENAESSQAKELNATLVDLRTLALLARYHADKKLAATHLEFFRLTNDKTRLKFAWKHILETQRHWQKIVTLTDGHYYDDLVLGFSKEHNSDFASRLQEHVGHWKDRLDDVQTDVDFVAQMMDHNGIEDRTLSEEEVKSMRRYPGETLVESSIEFQHKRIESTVPGKNLTVVARIESEMPLKEVSVYYRPLNQTNGWKRTTMTKLEEDGTYQAVIGAGEVDPRFDFQYYLEARHATGGQFWPKWQLETPYVVVPVVSP
ncbi:hypothetical protein AB1K70_20010 [Bremerella sp. JC770]|uniref:hypothetical protein n=1 Tax=Bremerella sp. JC770 TaxID=3232137 RepID=UPI0034598402